MNLRQLIGICMAITLLSCQSESDKTASYDVIPLPQKIESKDGSPFVLSSSTKIVIPEGDAEMQNTANLLSSYIKEIMGISLSITNRITGSDEIHLSISDKIENKEGYQLLVDQNMVKIEGQTPVGLFYGVQTLRKSLIPSIGSKKINLFPVEITDYPRFSYRGLHVDIARHFESVDYLKSVVDVLALHNMNTMHIHLTDDQGWRIEIKKHPKLTEIGSKRKGTIIGKTKEYDNIPHEGYLTQEEIKELLAYAQARHINVIPEIDLPGHMLALLASHPELSCRGDSLEIWGEWGVSDDVLCAGNEDVYTMLEDIFDEVIELFPSQYIHLGGDECPKHRWVECPKCQSKIKSLGLKSDKEYTAEHKLQSYFVKRVADYIESKGRKVIGWDEILDGGAPEGSTIMAWRSVNKGYEAASKGHQVIMTPAQFCYFDFYQTLNRKEIPLALGGYLPLDKVYSFDPITPELTPEQAELIIGVQANMWSEFFKDAKQREYMLIPRIDALAEVQWTDPSKKNYDLFINRLMRMITLYDKLDYNYALHFMDVKSTMAVNDEGASLITLSGLEAQPIYYTLDGSTPTTQSSQYLELIEIKESTQLNASTFHNGKRSSILSLDFDFSKTTNKPISLESGVLDPAYAFNGISALVDGIHGGTTYSDGTWLGFLGKELVVDIDLEKIETLSSVQIGTFVSVNDWIFGATKLTISLAGEDKHYTEVFSQSYPEAIEGAAVGLQELTANFNEHKARYVTITIDKTEMLPKWHPGHSSQAYLFVDEITIQ